MTKASPQRRVLATLAILALTPSPASAAIPCLTRVEATGLIAYALPQAILSTQARCRTTLPGNAYLMRDADQLAAHGASGRDRFWPQARAALTKLGLGLAGGGGPRSSQLMQMIGDDALRQLADVAVGGIVAQAIPLESCARIDRAAELLAPLPPENVAGLVTLYLEAARDRSGPSARAAASSGPIGAPAPGLPSPGAPPAAGLTICKE